MKKKEYLAPEMKVIKLQQQQHLLAGSTTVRGDKVFTDPYDEADEDEEVL